MNAGPTPPMWAVRIRTDGARGVDKFVVDEIPRPRPRRGEVLVRVQAVGLGSWERSFVIDDDPASLRRRTARRRVNLGLEVAGVVAEAGGSLPVGARVVATPHLTAGEKGLAEFVAVPASAVALIPSLDASASDAAASDAAGAHRPGGVSPVEAASLPVSAATAIVAVADLARIDRGQRLLVVGANGGVGMYAVQLAAARGAEVSALAGSAHDRLLAIGAARVDDYRTTPLADLGVFDSILDLSGRVRFRDAEAHLTPRGVFLNANPQRDLGGMLRARFGRRQAPFLYVPAVPTRQLERVLRLAADGTLTPMIEAVHRLDDLPAAMARLAEGSRSGKVVIAVE